MGRELENLEEVPAGNIVGMYGFGQSFQNRIEISNFIIF